MKEAIPVDKEEYKDQGWPTTEEGSPEIQLRWRGYASRTKGMGNAKYYIQSKMKTTCAWFSALQTNGQILPRATALAKYLPPTEWGCAGSAFKTYLKKRKILDHEEKLVCT